MLHQWAGLSVGIGMTIVLLWVAKDLLLFPFVRAAYEGDERQGADRLIGLQGTAATLLAPDGYVLVHGELWQAESADASQRIQKGAPVRVGATRGFTLVVAADKAQEASSSERR